MQKGFTMIELIFVMVVIGILAAVAIPKLAAVRDDANNARDCQNVVTCLTDLAATYAANGSEDTNTSACVEAITNQSDVTVTAGVSAVYGGGIDNCKAPEYAIVFGGNAISL